MSIVKEIKGIAPIFVFACTTVSAVIFYKTLNLIQKKNG